MKPRLRTVTSGDRSPPLSALKFPGSFIFLCVSSVAAFFVILEIFAHSSFSLPFLPSGLTPSISKVRTELLLRWPLSHVPTLTANPSNRQPTRQGQEAFTLTCRLFEARQLSYLMALALFTSLSFGLYPFFFFFLVLLKYS